MKQTPISSLVSSGCFFFASSTAIDAATSIGGSSGMRLSLRKGKRRTISLVMTGHAVLMTGFLMPSASR